MDNSTDSHKIIFIPELTNKIQANGFEHINVIDSNNVIITGENGFYHINYAEYKKKRYPLQSHISNVSLVSRKDSLLFGGYGSLKKNLSVAYEQNSLHFEVSTTLYGEETTIEYSYYLKGFDNGWSEWTKRSDKDYTNIPPGNYVFQVKSRNNFDNESPIASIAFSILPPWYRTWWAYSFYALVFVAVLYIFYKYQQHKYKTQQQIKLAAQQKKVRRRTKTTANATPVRTCRKRKENCAVTKR